MHNLLKGPFIPGLVGVIIFCLFVGGLAVSIGSIGFGLIAISVMSMAIYEFVEEVRKGENILENNRGGKEAIPAPAAVPSD